MDISKASEFFDCLVSCLNRDKAKVKKLFTTISKVFSNPSQSYFGRLLQDFPSVKFLQWVKEQVPELILACASLGDQVDAPTSCLSEVLNKQAFERVLLEASSSALQTKELWRSLEELAIQLPKIGIAELLVSSPLFLISAACPTSTCGTTAIQPKECADVDYSRLSEMEASLQDCSQQENNSLHIDLCEASPPRKRAKRETNISRDYSSKSTITICIKMFNFIQVY